MASHVSGHRRASAAGDLPSSSGDRFAIQSCFPLPCYMSDLLPSPLSLLQATQREDERTSGKGASGGAGQTGSVADVASERLIRQIPDLQAIISLVIIIWKLVRHGNDEAHNIGDQISHCVPFPSPSTVLLRSLLQGVKGELVSGGEKEPRKTRWAVKARRPSWHAERERVRG